jgi:hypothetical protein
MQIPRSNQQGVALLMLMFVLALGVAAYTLKALNSSGIENIQHQKTVQALAEAKSALIGYAVTYDDTHSGEAYGYMPCPDKSSINGAGSELNCGAAGEASIGRLPWKTLKVSPIRDGYGECLWYAVSGSFKNNPKQPLDPSTLGQLRIKTENGNFYAGSDVDPLVAVVFAPGSVVANQNRADSGEDEYCRGNYLALNYLDTVNNMSNADASDSIFVSDSSATFNDKLILITQSDIFKNYCGKYARKLSANVDIATSSNNCLDTGTGVANAECVALRGNIQYCALASCRTAADELITPSCLNNPSESICLAAVNELELCNA